MTTVSGNVHGYPQPGLGIAFEAGKKSTALAYVFWFFFGGAGAHRFYCGKTGSAVAQLTLSILGWLTLIVGIGLVALIGVGLWVLVDAFLIPGWIRRHNWMLAEQLGMIDARPSSGFADPEHE